MLTIQISEAELRSVVQAYHTFQALLEKVISPNELYQAEFLEGLTTAQTEVAEGKFSEVRDFADFIQ